MMPQIRLTMKQTKIMSAFALTQTNQYTYKADALTQSHTYPFPHVHRSMKKASLLCTHFYCQNMQFMVGATSIQERERKGAKYTRIHIYIQFSLEKVCVFGAAPYNFFI